MPRYSEATLAAIKNAVNIVTLIGDYLPSLTRSGSKFKALCPFHDDHTPSLEVNPERQSYKCWSCGAGGDVFDFVQGYDRVEFPEALRMLADRTGVALETPSTGPATEARGPSKSDLLAACAWAEQAFADALKRAPEVMAYVRERGINDESIERFRLGYAPDVRDWLSGRVRREGFSMEMLEKTGLIARSTEYPDSTRDRFRGRLIFPIHDQGGRTIGFGGRILPAAERVAVAAGKHVAKYINSPETALFKKSRLLYAADLARGAAREAKWVAVVEGYTDVIAAHQVGLANVVATLGTALTADHVPALRALADRVVLVFDGDNAGQTAADKALELFLGHEIDVRVLTLPDNLDPCDFLLKEGDGPFRALVEKAVDPLSFALRRAEARFDLNALEGSRQASEWVLTILAKVPAANRAGLDVKVGKALDKLSERLRVPVATLERRLTQLRRAAVGRPQAAPSQTAGPAAAPAGPPVRIADLDPIDRELIQIVLNDPSVAGRLISRVAVASLRDAPLRAILQACYDLHGEGESPTSERVMLRLDEPGVKSLAAGLLLPIERAPLPDSVRPASWEDRLAGVLAKLTERDWQNRLRDLKEALDETDANANPDEYRALQLEYRRLMNQRPDTKRKHAS
ncbi:MAG: DNA primase [Isosphaeraceae bacterium]|nr:DNA primase [Isosphaeraceae bacterium]